jgi:hypothetical protein
VTPVDGARRTDRVVALALLAVVAATVLLANLLPAAAPKGPPSTAGFGDVEKTCSEWTDGCITCERHPAGPACSTPGIACVRKPVACLRRD